MHALFQRRQLDLTQRAMIAARIANLGQGARTDLAPKGAKSTSRPAAAKLLDRADSRILRG
jgi:hypothetical protein